MENFSEVTVVYSLLLVIATAFQHYLKDRHLRDSCLPAGGGWIGVGYNRVWV